MVADGGVNVQVFVGAEKYLFFLRLKCWIIILSDDKGTRSVDVSS